jgi:predicted Fe-Mo cluster-binding NifX family protein
MKICVPTMGNAGMDERVGEHFGRVPTYTVYDTETEEITVMNNTSEHAGGVGLPAEILAKAGINTMLCGGLGSRAISLFEQSGVMVYVGASGTVADAINMWKAGKLQPATSETACQQHAFRGEGTGEKHGGGRHHHHD